MFGGALLDRVGSTGGHLAPATKYTQKARCVGGLTGAMRAHMRYGAGGFYIDTARSTHACLLYSTRKSDGFIAGLVWCGQHP